MYLISYCKLHLAFDNNNRKITKNAKSKSEDVRQASEPDSDVKHILELTDWEFKIDLINMLRSLMEKADNTSSSYSSIPEK